MVESASDGRPNNHADAEEGLEDGEHGGDIVGELLGNHAEAASEEAGVADGLDDPGKLS